MHLFKFLWSTSKAKALQITVLSVINGVAGGLLVILLPHAAVDIYLQNRHLFYLILKR